MARTNSHTISHAENLYSGDAYQAGAEGDQRGIPMASLVQVSLGAPILLDANGLVTGETLSAAGNFTFNGALWSTPDTDVTLDVPRGVQIVNAGASTTVITFYGTDKYGVPIQESITSDGTTPVFGLKAFKTITRIAAAGNTTGNVTIGTSDILGLPFRLENVADVLVINENDQNLFQVTAKTAADPASATAAAAALTASATGAVTGTNPTAPTDYTALTNYTDPVTKAEGETLSAALATLADEAIAMEIIQSAMVVDDAAQKVVIDQNVVDVAAQKVELDKLITDVGLIRAEVIKLVADIAAVDTGTLVKADATVTATATTGDVRGTYNPTAVLDGTKVFKLTFKPKGRATRSAYGSVQYRS